MAPSRHSGVARYCEFLEQCASAGLLLSLSFVQSHSFASLRGMGHFSLCGALYVAYQSNDGDLHGDYMLCALFKTNLLLALPQKGFTFGVVAIINTSGIQIVDVDNGRGKKFVRLKCIDCDLISFRASMSHRSVFMENDVRARPAAI